MKQPGETGRELGCNQDSEEVKMNLDDMEIDPNSPLQNLHFFFT
jgi:hypothetical protein